MDHDEVPIGSCAHPMIITQDEHNNTSADHTSLDSRLTNKAWKVRYDAFDELISLLSLANNIETAQIQAPLFKKYLVDSHPGVQEKALDAFSALLKNYPSTVVSFIKDVVTCILEKCITSMKPSVKAKALDVLVEASKTKEISNLASIVVNNIDKSKVPKTIVGDIQVLVRLMKEQGKEAFVLEEVMEVIKKNVISSNNTAVRSEALEFYKVAHSIFGEDIMPFVKNLKAGQQSELMKVFEEQEETLMLDIQQESPINKVKHEIKAPVTIKKPDESINSLEQFDDTWCSNILSLKKWNEKRDKLEELLGVVKAPIKVSKVHPELIAALAKLVDDNNSVVAQSSLKIVSLLTDQPKEDYKLVIKPIILRLKDKKAATEAIKCLESLSPFIVLDDVVNDIKEALNDRSPVLKISLCQWLENSIIPLPSNINAFIDLFPILSSFLDEAAGDVRESALGCLTALYKVSLKNSILRKLFTELPQQKLEKITVAKTPNIHSKPFLNPQSSWKESKPPISKFMAPSTNNRRRSPGHLAKRSPSNVVSKGELLNKGIKESPRYNKSPLISGLSRKRLSEQSKKAVSHSKATESSFSAEVAEIESEKLVTDILPQHIIEAMNKTEWKDRLKGFQDLVNWIPKNRSKVNMAVVQLATWIRINLKDFKENNQAILKEAFTIIAYLAESPNATKKLTLILLPGIIEKMGDTKWYDTGIQIVNLLLPTSGVTLITNKVIEKINSAGKNSNLAKAALSLLSLVIDDSELTELPLNDIINCAKQAVSNKNSTIRSAGTSVFCSLYKIMGEELRPLISDLKEATLKTVEGELSKIKVKVKPAHKRTHSDTSDVNSVISQRLLASIEDPDVKVRKDAKLQLEKIISTADKKSLSKNQDSLVSALKGRINEQSKMLAKDYIALIGTLALAMGIGFSQYSDIVLSPLIEKLNDKHLKHEAISTLNKIEEAVGTEHLADHFKENLKKGTSRLEILEWMLNYKEVINETWVEGIVDCLQDKNKEVESKAERVVSAVIPNIGVTPFNSAIENLNPNSKNTLRILFAKYSQYKEDKSLSYKLPQKHCNSQTKVLFFIPKPYESNIRLTLPDIDLSPTNGAKVERAEYEKTHRWNVKELQKESILFLKTQLKNVLPTTLFESMFSADKNTLITSINNLKGILENNCKQIENSLDLIFKWASLILMERGDYEILKAVVELVKNIFDKLITTKYQLLDFEANSILPGLCEKMCYEELKYEIKKTVKNIKKMYPLSKLGNYFVRALDSHSNETKAECLICLQELVSKHGLKVITARDIKSFGKILNYGAIPQVEYECVMLLAEIYKKKGDTIWISLGELNSEVKKLLKEKFELTINEVDSKNDNEAASPSNIPQIKLHKPKEEEEAIPSCSIDEISSIEDCIRILGRHDDSRQAEAISFIDKFSTTGLPPYMNTLVSVLADGLNYIFEANNYPIQFVNDYLKLIKKLSKNTDLIFNIDYIPMFKLMSTLLTCLLSPSISKFGDEKDLITKNIDKIMATLMRKCFLNTSFKVLISMYNTSEGKGKLPDLIINCLLRLKKKLKDVILDVVDLLVQIQNYIVNSKENSEYSKMGMKVIKKILNKLVKIKGYEIWTHYENAVKATNFNNYTMKRWITLMLSARKPQEQNVSNDIVQGSSSEKAIKVNNEFKNKL